MTVRFTRDQVFAGVREDVVTTLAIEPEEVELQHNFFHDLAGESIDMLDLGFRSERRLGIRSPFHRLTEADGWRFDDTGKLTAESLQRLQSEFPQIDWAGRLGAVSLRSVKDIVTIDLIVDLLYHAQANASAPATLKH